MRCQLLLQTLLINLVSIVKQELQQFSGSVSSFTNRLKLPHLSTHAIDERSSTTAQSQSVAQIIGLSLNVIAQTT